MGVLSPLLEAGLGKVQVRELARRRGLPNSDKPAQPCLSSRIAYGMPVTIASLQRIEQAEAFLRRQGFAQMRVRHHGPLARIEVEPAELPRLCAEPLRTALVEHLRGLGYTYVTVDLRGFRSGSGNEVLAGRPGGGAGSAGTSGKMANPGPSAGV
jgi:uncharacterized protein